MTADDLGDRRRATILAAAEELLSEHGFESLRLRDVARAAGVSIGLIQHYFGTRDELLRETMRTASAHRVRQWQQHAADHDRPPAKLAALLDGSISDRHRCVAWLETCAAATRHPVLITDVESTQAAWHDSLREVIDAGVRSGDFAPAIPVPDVVAVLVGLIDGLMLAAATEPPGEDREAYRLRLLREAAQRLLGDRHGLLADQHPQ